MKQENHKSHRLIALLTAAIALSGVGILVVKAAAPHQYNRMEAKEAAFSYFGVEEKDVKQLEGELDDGMYEFAFATDGVWYECDVNALTGAVVNAELRSQALDNPTVAAYIEKNGFISVETALASALAHFGLAPDAALTAVSLELDDDDYELEFTTGGVWYECDINAATGRVIYSRNRAGAGVTGSQKTAAGQGTTGSQGTADGTNAPSSALATEEEAIQAALAHFGLEPDAPIQRLKIEQERRRYEVEFHLDGVKYECDVNRETKEVVKSTVNGNGASAYIAAMGFVTREAAEETALRYLGITTEDYQTVKYELDDGEYEFEFRGPGMEYECDVDALTGVVVHAEINDQPYFNEEEDKTAAKQTGDKLTREEALAAALAAFGITEADYRKADIELEDGWYEIELEGKGMEYECKVNATTGEIRNLKSERD